MKKYLTLFVGIFMVSACAAAPVRQVAVQGDDYYVSIGSYPRHHHIHHPIIIRPVRPRHPRPIVHMPPRPPHHSHSVHPSQPSHQSHSSPLRG